MYLYLFSRDFFLECFREHLRCLNVINDRLEMCYNLAGNKQIVRDSWIHEKV